MAIATTQRAIDDVVEGCRQGGLNVDHIVADHAPPDFLYDQIRAALAAESDEFVRAFVRQAQKRLERSV